MAEPNWWLVQELETNPEYVEVDNRLRKELLQAARRQKKRGPTGEPSLTSEAVAAIRDGSSGGGCFRRMSRMLAGSDRRPADWLWYTVAEMQKAKRVSAEAQRTMTGATHARTEEQRQWIGWRRAVGVKLASWEGIKLKALEVIARIQGDTDGLRVPTLRKENKRKFYSLLHKAAPGVTSNRVMAAVLWVLAATEGVQVEWQREEVRKSTMTTEWTELRQKLRHWPGALQELRQVRMQVGGWAVAMEAAREERNNEVCYVVDWFAGWPEVMRKVTEEAGLKLIAVDNRTGLGEEHPNNVQMDMLKVAPQFWRAEVARLQGVSVSMLGPNWFGVPCKTMARCDATNATRKGKKVCGNYRVRLDGMSVPQHGAGTEKGDLARQANRLVEAVCWVAMDSGQSWAVENPDGQMQHLPRMFGLARWLNRVDYCMLWTEQERSRGFTWKKMTCVWTRGKDGSPWEGPELCTGHCLCMVEGTKGHKGHIEQVTGAMRKSGLGREELKCRYPEELVRRWLEWALKREHRRRLV